MTRWPRPRPRLRAEPKSSTSWPVCRGQLDQAAQTAGAIDDPFARQEAVAQLALSRLRAGDIDTALTWTDRIHRLDERKDVLIRLASELSREP